MMITFSESKIHWNYLFALVEDLQRLARYIEFTKDNLSVYSIELARTLITAASEVDVVLKQYCYLIDPRVRVRNINQYKEVIAESQYTFNSEAVTIPRFGLTYRPWENWQGDGNPDWWTSYNAVKHDRSHRFKEANLHNALNSVAGLFILLSYFYKLSFSIERGTEVSFQETFRVLTPELSFIRMAGDYYHQILIT